MYIEYVECSIGEGTGEYKGVMGRQIFSGPLSFFINLFFVEVFHYHLKSPKRALDLDPVGSTVRYEVMKLEFENHKNQYFSWLLRSEHIETSIFGNRMTKLTI